MRQSQKNIKIYNQCVEKGMCEWGKIHWEISNEKLINLAKKESEFLIEKRPFTCVEIIKFFPQDWLSQHGMFVLEKLNDERIYGRGEHLLALNTQGCIILKEMSNILSVAENSNLIIRIQNTGFYTIKVYKGCRVKILAQENCGCLVINKGGEVETYSLNDSARIKVQEI